MENIKNKNDLMLLNAPYDMSGYVFQSPQLTVLDYISGMGDFTSMCEPFPSGVKPTIIGGSPRYFITYNFYNMYGFQKNRNRITPTQKQELSVVQLNLSFDTSYSTNTIVIDGRDVIRGSVPASILEDKLQPQLRAIKLAQVETDWWTNIKDYINPLTIDLSTFTDLNDIVKQGKVLEYATKIKDEITKKINELKKLKLEWCSFYGIPKEDLIIYMTPEMIDVLPLTNSMIYTSNENITKSAQQLFPKINDVRVIPSSNQKDNCGFDMLITTKWTCASMVANVGVRIANLEGTAKDLCLNAEFIADGKCKFYNPKDKSPKCPVMFGYTLKFKP